MTILKYVTTALIAFVMLMTGVVARDTDNDTALVGMGVLLATDILSLICIWG